MSTAEDHFVPVREPLRAIVRRRSLGVVMIMVVIALITLSIEVFNKTFVAADMITLYTDHTGNQLDPSSDVKVRGIIVGEVRSVSSRGDGAKLRIALDPARIDIIPGNVTAQILPKTLLGQRYVSLVLPAVPAAHIKKGAVIEQDRSSAAIQFSKVLSDLLPVLDALKPAELNATLNALATALEGRGAQLGRNIDEFDSYLKSINPYVDQLVSDLDQFGDVALEYDQAAPALLDTLANLKTTSATISSNQQNLSALLKSGTGAVDALNTLLSNSGPHLIRVTAQTNDVAAVFATYAPEYTCLFAGIAADQSKLIQAFRDGALHVEVSLVKERGKYVAGDEPVYPTGFGPTCNGLGSSGNPFYSPDADDLARQAGTGAAYSGGASSGALESADASAVGSDAESAMINSLIAGQYGTTPDQVPDVATVLAGPILRGSDVSAK
jgi:phospholipid/cholesterol/gamma-HCH transport system substrate-binding protein